MNPRRIWLGAAALLLACSGDSAPEATPTPDAAQPAVEAGIKARLAVLYTNNLDGEIEPCG